MSLQSVNRQTSRDSHALGRQPVDERAAEEHVAVGLQQVPAAAAVIDECGNKAPAPRLLCQRWTYVRFCTSPVARNPAQYSSRFSRVNLGRKGGQDGCSSDQECWRRGLLSALVIKNASCLSHEREQLAEVENPTRTQTIITFAQKLNASHWQRALVESMTNSYNHKLTLSSHGPPAIRVAVSQALKGWPARQGCSCGRP